jgi:hypothetical protein
MRIISLKTYFHLLNDEIKKNTIIKNQTKSKQKLQHVFVHVEPKLLNYI